MRERSREGGRSLSFERSLTFHQGGEQRDVGGFPPSGGQVETQAVQLLPETPSAVLGLRSADGKSRD